MDALEGDGPMHGTTRTRPSLRSVRTGVNAVVWIDRGGAIVVRGTGTGEPASLELPLPASDAATPPVLAEIAHQVGDADRVLVLGAEDLRTALEREIVAIGHRPEAIRDERQLTRPDRDTLVDRLRRLA
jgi:hypothetical protein